MDTLFELVIFIIFGVLGVGLSRFLKPKDVAKQNSEVVVKVEELQKKNDQINQDIESETSAAKVEIDELEKEKNKDLNNQELEDFFNNRKS